MRAVFPCKGVLVLTKKDVEALQNFYNSTLEKSNIFSAYNATEYSIQVGNFNYLPQKATLIVDEKNLLTISKLRAIMNGSVPTKKEEPVVEENPEEVLEKSTEESLEDPLSDDDILSHPFFTTLKPID